MEVPPSLSLSVSGGGGRDDPERERERERERSQKTAQHTEPGIADERTHIRSRQTIMGTVR